MEQRANAQPQFWGALATFGWGILILFGFVLSQGITAVLYVMLTSGEAPRLGSPALESLKFDGRLLFWCTFASTIVSVAAIIAVINLKRVETWRLSRINFGQRAAILLLLLILALFVAASDGISILMGKPITPEFMVKTYTSLESPNPVGGFAGRGTIVRRTFFRGFLIKGLSASALKWYGAVVISSVMWAAIHIQYDLYGIATILVLGFILASPR